jgi:hypothetical protein
MTNTRGGSSTNAPAWGLRHRRANSTMVRESNGRFSLEQSTKELIGALRGIEAYEPATNSWTTLPSMPMPRHGAVIGNRFHLVSGMVQSAGTMAFLDPHLHTPHGGARRSYRTKQRAPAADNAGPGRGLWRKASAAHLTTT